MSPENFCYWLRGYLELLAAGDGPTELNEEQCKLIDKHLDLVFTRATSDDAAAAMKEAFSPEKVKEANRRTSPLVRWTLGGSSGIKYC